MKSVDNVEKYINRANAIPSAAMNHRTLADIFAAQEASKRADTASCEPTVRRTMAWPRAGTLAAAVIVFFSCLACFVLSGRITDLSGKVASLNAELVLARRDSALAQQNIAPTPTDNTTTINLYLQEHRDVIARHASFSSTGPQPVQMRVNRHDVLYYEFFNDGPDTMRPGMIVRGSSPRRDISPSEAPVISNGHALSLSEARETAGFNLVAQSWLHPGYKLDEIRRIEGRSALQLLYTDGINSVSLFEQSLEGQRGLEPQDFREYAVYRNKEQAEGTILAWKDDGLSYVLIGNTDMSQLMDMAQSIGPGQ